MKRIAFLFPFALLLLCCFSPESHACSCAFGGAAPCQEYWQTEAIFSGTIIGSSSIEVNYDSDKTTQRLLRVAIKQAFRGVDGGQIEVVTGWGGGDCGFEFKLGETYLIYGSRSKADARLHTSICTRTRALADAADDLAFIGSLPTADTGSLIFGQVGKRNYFWKEGETYFKPVPDAELTVEGEGVRRELKADESGKFRVGGLAPGTYKVLLKLPEGLLRNAYVKDEGATIVENEVTVAAHGCAETEFLLDSDSSVSGQVLDAAGQPVANLTLDLRSGVPTKNNYNAFKRAKTDAEGRFQFKVVPPGEYLLGFRLLSQSGAEVMPYPRTYYPGVPSRAGARLVSVKEGATLDGIDVYMPSRLAEYSVDGLVVWSEGQPASGVNIYLSLMEEGDMTANITLQADERGQFTLKLYEGLQYKVSAYPQRDSGPAAQSPWLEVPHIHGPKTIKLVLPGSRPPDLQKPQSLSKPPR